MYITWTSCFPSCPICLRTEDRYLYLHWLRTSGVWCTEGDNFVIPVRNKNRISAKVTKRIIFACADLQELFEFLPGNVILLKIKLEKVRVERRRSRFVFRVVVGFKIRMSQALLHRHSLL
jgi:hypothetical protein